MTWPLSRRFIKKVFMWLVLFRAFVLALLAHAGYAYQPVPGGPLAGLVLGLALGGGLIMLELKLRAVPGHHMVGALVGGVTGLFGARLVWGALEGLDIAGEHFVHVMPFGQTPQTRHVRGSNHCFIGVVGEAKTGRATVISALDNLTKGASGQGVQNFNLMHGFPETTALEQQPLFP